MFSMELERVCTVKHVMELFAPPLGCWLPIGLCSGITSVLLWRYVINKSVSETNIGIEVNIAYTQYLCVESLRVGT